MLKGGNKELLVQLDDGSAMKLPRAWTDADGTAAPVRCQARRAQEWALWLPEERLKRVLHHHVVFTIPKMLRAPVSLERLWYNPEAGTVTTRRD